MLNDEMATGSIRMYAQQGQLALDERQATGMSTEELKSDLVSGLTSKQLDTELSIKMSAYYTEFKYHRHANDSRIDSLIDSAIKKYGPCWGIPVGQCKE
jgi:hypothetical protein